MPMGQLLPCFSSDATGMITMSVRVSRSSTSGRVMCGRSLRAFATGGGSVLWGEEEGGRSAAAPRPAVSNSARPAAINARHPPPGKPERGVTLPASCDHQPWLMVNQPRLMVLKG